MGVPIGAESNTSADACAAFDKVDLKLGITAVLEQIHSQQSAACTAADDGNFFLSSCHIIVPKRDI